MIDRERILNRRRGLFGIKEGAEFLLAIVAIGLIAFFAVKLYGWATADNESESAKALLDVLEERIERMEEIDSTTVIFQGNSFLFDGRWYITAFSKGGERPDKCFFSSCVCICKKLQPSSKDAQKVNAEICQGENGFCRKIEGEAAEVDAFYKYNDLPDGEICGDGEGNIFSGVHRSALLIPKNLFEAKIFTGNGLTRIVYVVEGQDCPFDSQSQLEMDAQP